MTLDLGDLGDVLLLRCREELGPHVSCGPSRTCQDVDGVDAEVAVLAGCRPDCGNLTKVGHQGREVACTQRPGVHSLTTCTGCEGQVRCHPRNGSQESRHACRACCRGVSGAPKAIVVDGLVEENNGLSQVGSPLDGVNHTLRTDPRQLLRLRVIEEVVQVAQRMGRLQSLGLADDPVHARKVLPSLNLIKVQCSLAVLRGHQARRRGLGHQAYYCE
mmetsp:Transcript_48932/g.87949  ORF Transcript_48932/g.87949 Transcript_48932/m.87949 type:complete len:217 (-) Transcript_48932:153-803(-)